MFKEFALSLIDILWPKSCHACSRTIRDEKERYDDHFCLTCFSKMRPNPANVCPLCGAEKKDRHNEDPACRACRSRSPAYERLVSCYAYKGPAQKLIHAFKYRNEPYLAKTIASLMFCVLQKRGMSFLGDCTCIIPIPLHPERRREREFNQAELLGAQISKQTGKPILRLLERRKNTRPQAQLTKTARLSNVKGVFKTKDSLCLRGKNVLIVDDIATTGATIREASAILKKAGAGKIRILTFANGTNQ